MVAIGAARGIKDMRIPLLGSLSYLVALVAADSFLLYGPPALGIEGAGLGASIAQWVGAATVCGLLARKQVCGWVAAWECGAGLGGRRREATPAALRVAARCAGIPCPCTPATRLVHPARTPPTSPVSLLRLRKIKPIDRCLTCATWPPCRLQPTCVPTQP